MPRTGAGDPTEVGDARRLLLGSPLFDEEWYALATGAVGGREALVDHYLATPVERRTTPQPLFDPAWFAERWEAATARQDPFVDYLRNRPYAVRTSPLLLEGFVRRPVAQRHPHGPLGRLRATTTAGELPRDPWQATRGRKPYADLRAWMLAVAGEWRARRDGDASTDTGTPPGPETGPRVLVGAHDDWRVVARTLRALAQTLPTAGPEGDSPARVAVVDHDTSALGTVMLEAWVLDFAARTSLPVTVVRGTVASAWGEATGRRVLMAAGTQPHPGWWEPLLGALDEPGVAVAAPLLLASDGSVRSAGTVGRGAHAHDLLAGHPAEDATQALGRVDLDDVRRAVVAVDDLAVQGAFRTCPGSRVVEHDDVGSPPVTLGGSATPAGTVTGSDPWSALGFELVEPGTPPRLRRPRVEVSPGVPRLRWALRIASTPGPVGDAWGDTHFAGSLAQALRARGQEVVVDRRGAFDRPTTYLDDVALVLRGLHPMVPVPGAVNLCWVISHPDLVAGEEATSYDRVFAASAVWAQARSREWGIEVEPMLQATDTTRFAPDPTVTDTGHRVLFVGSSRGVDRRVVTDAVGARLPLAVYGPQWDERIPAEYVRGTYLPNDRLGAAYAAAGVVLNDHWDDMLSEGFLSNRLFDAVASGARVVTDPVAGLGETFGRSVQPYATRADLVRLCDPTGYDQHFGDGAERLATAERVRREHSFAARAERLLAVALELGAGGRQRR